MDRKRKTRAFTLIEMLVVIAIIVLLLALSMPAMSKAIRASQTVVCASNLHQVGVGLLSYSSDYSAHIPWQGNWARFQQMLYMTYMGPAPGFSVIGFQNLGLLQSNKYIPSSSDVFFCPIQSDRGLGQSNGDPTHPNATPNPGLGRYLQPADASYKWLNNRSGYHTRNLGDLTGKAMPPIVTSTDWYEAPTVSVIAGKTYLADAVSVTATAQTGHGNTVNAWSGDGAVAARPLDTTALPAVYDTAYNPIFSAIWAKYDR
jgi:prepilin-type N-terminal cleavage/methylation domain-containing protein